MAVRPGGWETPPPIGAEINTLWALEKLFKTQASILNVQSSGGLSDLHRRIRLNVAASSFFETKKTFLQSSKTVFYAVNYVMLSTDLTDTLQHCKCVLGTWLPLLPYLLQCARDIPVSALVICYFCTLSCIRYTS